jgi:murein DD-endopeptidase MepM/ murein hydrolase activator NlpD
VARDITWRQQSQREPQRRLRLRLGILAALLAINIGVFVYHGDPRDRMPQRPSSTRATPAPRPTSRATEPTGAAEPATESTPPTSTVAQATEQTAPPATLATAGIAAVTNPSATPGLTEALSPTAGMRTPARVQRVVTTELKRGQTVAAALTSLGVRSEEVTVALASLKGVVDFRRLRPGHSLKARFDADRKLVGLDVQIGLTERARAHKSTTGWQGHPLDVYVDTITTTVKGQVRSSLWESLIGAGERPWLITEIVDMFAWDIDFYTEIYPGDTFKVLVEKRYLDGEFVGYGALLAGEFVTNKISHRAYRFEAGGGGFAYYDEQGRSLRKQLLRSPLQYGNVTSGFGNRMHPILGYNRAHNGIDYGVPLGTPVWSVGDGHVTRASYDAGFGRIIEVRHPNGWVSQYAHLSRIDVKVGQRVSQKEFIAKTGSTGMSTGPHLHYGLKRFNAYVNPAAQKFERGKSLEGTDLERFKTAVQKLVTELDRVSVAGRGPAGSVKEG